MDLLYRQKDMIRRDASELGKFAVKSEQARLTKDVRLARSLGHVYGSKVPEVFMLRGNWGLTWIWWRAGMKMNIDGRRWT
jgi:hypothetical protein